MAHPFIPILNRLTDRAKWLGKREEAIYMARRTRETLIDAKSHWRYPPDDSRVAAAVQIWVDRARHAHAIAMGRHPVMSNVIINNKHYKQLFAR